MDPIRIFISYASQNETWLREWLDENQKQRNRRYFIDFWKRSLGAKGEDCVFWWDREESSGIRGGKKWRARILEEVDRAEVAVLLITQDFVVSDFIRKEELPRILARARRDETEVVPILVSPAQWEELDVHGLFQITPGKPTPLSQFLDSGEHSWETARLEVAEALVAAVKRARKRREPPTPPPVPTPVPPLEEPAPRVPTRKLMSPGRLATAIAFLALLGLGVAVGRWCLQPSHPSGPELARSHTNDLASSPSMPVTPTPSIPVSPAASQAPPSVRRSPSTIAAGSWVPVETDGAPSPRAPNGLKPKRNRRVAEVGQDTLRRARQRRGGLQRPVRALGGECPAPRRPPRG